MVSGQFRAGRGNSVPGARQLVGGEYGEVEEELEELDESHDGKAEPETENTARVGDVLQQLNTQSSHFIHYHCTVKKRYFRQYIKWSDSKGKNNDKYETVIQINSICTSQNTVQQKSVASVNKYCVN